jgi:hypothetical protein
MAKDAGFWYRTAPKNPFYRGGATAEQGFCIGQKPQGNALDAGGLGSTRKDERRFLYMSRESDKNFRVFFPRCRPARAAQGRAAATAHRGVRLIRLPTTTLSQADSGVGVKNGINVNSGSIVRCIPYTL